MGPQRAVCPRFCKPQTILKRQVCSFGKKKRCTEKPSGLRRRNGHTRPPPVTTRRLGGQAARRASRSAVWTDADASRGRGAGGPEGKRCASWGGGPRKAPARDSAAETETGGDRGDRGDRYCSYGISVAVSDGERRGFSARPPARRGRPRKLFHHFFRKVMSLMNLKLHKGRERVRERINDGESPPFFILYLLI